jgi:hypothetical protein
MMPMESVREPWKPTRAPEYGTEQFRSHVERFEASAWNVAGTDKGWVEEIREIDASGWPRVVRETPAGPRTRLFEALGERRVRYLVIGVGGVNMHAAVEGAELKTQDLDLFLPLDPANLERAWEACEHAGWTLWSSGEPLDQPHDLLIASRVVQQRALTTARAQGALPTDLSLVMGNFEFEDVWLRRTWYREAHAHVDLCRLADIVAAKQEAGRLKDHDFLAENRKLLDRLLSQEGPPGCKS